MKDIKKEVSYDDNISAKPVAVATWRGRLKIPNHNLNINVGAHVLNKAGLIASVLPETLCFEIVPRSELWPATFKSSPPNEHSVNLLFFSQGRDDEILDGLLIDAIVTNFALKAKIGETELLVFPSFHLPEKLHRFQGKFYWWGVFREQESATSHQSDHQVDIQNTGALSSNSGNDGSLEGNGSSINVSSSTSHSDKRGRPLDDGWEHAKPLDELRQKAECRYCGFISSRGGISRLKAHLAGGNLKTRLPACRKVPPEVQKLMAEWFSEWAKNTKALWIKEIKGNAKLSPDIKGVSSECFKESTSSTSPATKGSMSEWINNLMKTSQEAETRGRSLDDAWEHAKPLDEARQKTKCKYCGFVSSYGGISRLKAHLGGGCSKKQLKGCPKVSLEVKSVMKDWFKEWAKNSKAVWIRKSPHEIASKRGRPLDDTWEHGTPIDEMRQGAKCKYCDFVSTRGGIARLKAHLSGGDPTLQIEGCPNVSSEVKSLMSEGIINKCNKKQKETVREVVHDTSGKESLRKLIDEKNSEFQKMQVEIRYLESRLASMP